MNLIENQKHEFKQRHIGPSATEEKEMLCRPTGTPTSLKNPFSSVEVAILGSTLSTVTVMPTSGDFEFLSSTCPRTLCVSCALALNESTIMEIKTKKRIKVSLEREVKI